MTASKARDFGNKCICCGRKSHLTKDHILPQKWVGPHKKDNIQVLCYRCNQHKSRIESELTHLIYNYGMSYEGAEEYLLANFKNKCIKDDHLKNIRMKCGCGNCSASRMSSMQ